MFFYSRTRSGFIVGIEIITSISFSKMCGFFSKETLNWCSEIFISKFFDNDWMLLNNSLLQKLDPKCVSRLVDKRRLLNQTRCSASRLIWWSVLVCLNAYMWQSCLKHQWNTRNDLMFSLHFRIVTSFLPSWYSMHWLPVRSLLQRFDDSKYRSTDLFWITLWGLSYQWRLCLVQGPGKSYIVYTSFTFVEIRKSSVLLVCLKTRQIDLFVCLLEVFDPTREIFTDFDTLSLSEMGYRFLPMFGTYGHWAMKVL